MTRPKRPLPTLRFVIFSRNGKVLYRLIPRTTPKGVVMKDLWAVPGEQIQHTADLIRLCSARGWRHKIEGSAR